MWASSTWSEDSKSAMVRATLMILKKARAEKFCDFVADSSRFFADFVS